MVATVLGMSKSLLTYTKALYGFDAAVQRADDTSWSNASPCDGWTAADVLAHNIGMNNMISGFCAGIDSKGPSHELPDDPAGAWKTSFDGLLDALDTKGALHSVARTPWGEMPTGKFLGFAWIDPVIHTWDLAKATGQPAVLDAELVARGTKQLEQAGDSLVGPGRFEPATQAGSGADPVDAFVALSGRSVS